MKTCKTCSKDKPLSSFYVHKAMLDGHLNICKDCTKARVSKHRALNIDSVRAYDKQRAMKPERVNARKEYAKTEAGKKSHAKALINYREKHTDRYFAHQVFSNAIKDGKVEKLPCFICGDNKVEGHHPDYSRPLDVVWLCNKHHREAHKTTPKV
jgi:hypothetical protein